MMLRKLNLVKVFIIITLLLPSIVLAVPKLNFTDLVDGPSTGLGDGLGSGVIVTLWGQNLFSDINQSKIIFTDSLGNEHDPAYIYYWKNADGVKPSGVANLYVSHKMQEVAFSVPNVIDGDSFIHVIVNGEKSNKLPFLVRSGEILHIKANGSDGNTGEFDSALKTLPFTVASISNPGATVYIHDDLVTEDLVSASVVYWNQRKASSSADNHFSIVAYPSSHPVVIGKIGFNGFFTEGQIISKLKILTSNCDEGSNGQPINCALVEKPNCNAEGINGKIKCKLADTLAVEGTKYGRIISNAISDRPNGCVSSSKGAINGAHNNVFDLKIYGNEIYDYGCEGSSKFHHTTYMSIRSSQGLVVNPWEFGWNYLHDNHAKNGIHNFDVKAGPDNACGTANDVVKIHDNVIVNQSGAGIFIGTNCDWSNIFEIYNNLIINSGLPADWDGIDPNTSNDPNTSAIVIADFIGLGATIKIFNNSMYNWHTEDVNKEGRACFSFISKGSTSTATINSNLCLTDTDERFLHEQIAGNILDKVNSSNNAWFYTGDLTVVTNAVQPDIGNDLRSDLKVNFLGAGYSVSLGSPLINNSNTSLSYDLYGNKRSIIPTIGAVEFILRPNPPSSLEIN